MQRTEVIAATTVLIWAIMSATLTVKAADKDIRWDVPKAAGPYDVNSVSYDWLDEPRSRHVPVKTYYPKSPAASCPIIIFSHGLGGSRDGYEYLGRHWASHGYVSVHVQHKGSDSEVWKGAKQPEESLRRAAADLSNFINRPKDVSFAITQILKANGEQSPFRGRLDPEKIGVAGHSFGGYTVLAVAGQTFPGVLGGKWTFGDSRVRAAIPMSAPAPRRRDSLDRVFGSIKIPCLHMTGTLDDSPIGDTKAAERRIPFDHMQGADQFLVTFTGGDHMIFSGRARAAAALGGRAGWQGDPAKDTHFQELIRTITTAYWDAYLKGDPQAKAWLAKGGCKTLLEADGKIEVKLK
jgi:predicted dienelactone hydrolase